MNNNIIVKKEDYEIYRIPLPVTNIFPRRKKKYIYEELEKRHPCFSEDFYFYNKNKLLSKGLFSDVVVMEKSKLAEYKNKSRKGKLLLETNGKLKVFNKKTKNYVLLLFIIVLIIVFLFSFVNKKSKTESENIDLSFENNQIGINNINKSYNSYSDYNQKNLEKLINTVKNNKGKITCLNWNINLMQEEIFCSLKNIYPEKIQAIFNECEIPIVNYREGQPFFDFNIRNSLLLDNQSLQDNNISYECKNIIREYLINKSKIIEENTNPFGIILELDLEKNRKLGINDFFTGLDDLIKKYDVYIVGFSLNNLNQNSNLSSLNCNIVFSNNKVLKNEILQMIDENLDLFFEPKENNSIQKKIIKNVLPENIDVIENKNFKIGEIHFKNGKKIEFYRNSEGKIIKKESL